MNPVIAKCKCPFNEVHDDPETLAGVCRESKGTQRNYYLRCPECGTIQARAMGGATKAQDYIQRHMVPLDLIERDQVAEEVASEAAEQAKGQAKREAKRSRSVLVSALSSVLGGSDEEVGDDDDA